MRVLSPGRRALTRPHSNLARTCAQRFGGVRLRAEVRWAGRVAREHGCGPAGASASPRSVPASSGQPRRAAAGLRREPAPAAATAWTPAASLPHSGGERSGARRAAEGRPAGARAGGRNEATERGRVEDVGQRAGRACRSATSALRETPQRDQCPPLDSDHAGARDAERARNPADRSRRAGAEAEAGDEDLLLERRQRSDASVRAGRPPPAGQRTRLLPTLAPAELSAASSATKGLNWPPKAAGPPNPAAPPAPDGPPPSRPAPEPEPGPPSVPPPSEPPGVPPTIEPPPPAIGPPPPPIRPPTIDRRRRSLQGSGRCPSRRRCRAAARWAGFPSRSSRRLKGDFRNRHGRRLDGGRLDGGRLHDRCGAFTRPAPSRSAP